LLQSCYIEIVAETSNREAIHVSHPGKRFSMSLFSVVVLSIVSNGVSWTRICIVSWLFWNKGLLYSQNGLFLKKGHGKPLTWMWNMNCSVQKYDLNVLFWHFYAWPSPFSISCAISQLKFLKHTFPAQNLNLLMKAILEIRYLPFKYNSN
jgi:hypothetical protein